LAPKYSRKNSKKNPPPYPPQAGEEVRDHCDQDLHRQQRGPPAPEDALAHVEAAYRAVFDTGLPAAWRRKVRKELRHGDPALLLEIDAEAVREARRLAARKGRTFGFGWVLRVASDRIAKRKAEERAKLRQAEAAADREREQAEAEALHARQQAYFEALPPEQQARFRAEAERQAPIKRPELIAVMAVQLAWNSRSAETTA